MAPPLPFPDRLGVFPLPQVVLFPRVELPLHVFEPRYRTLLADALKGDRRLVMAVLRPGYEADYYGCPDVYPWACAGQVVKHQLLEDGCSDVVLHGERVVRIEEFVQDVPYRVARIVSFEDDDRFASTSGAGERLRELREVAERACPGAASALERRLACPVEKDGGLELLNTVASCFPVPVEHKVEWLGGAGSLGRWERMRDTLRDVARERERKARAIVRYADLKPPDPKHN
jgi:Lon protease-like protein